MASQVSLQDRNNLEKFIRQLAMKSAQIIVQSRLGEKIATESNTATDWFNIAITDQPDVLVDTKKALQGSQHESIISRLPLCVEISLQTAEGGSMILEVWSLSIRTDQTNAPQRATNVIYNRMGLLLKSLLSVTRVTPAYRVSRLKRSDSYDIYYRIYIGDPQTHQLGDGHNQVRVGQLCTQIGTLNMAVAYRTKITFSPTQTGRDNTIMLKSDHFLKDLSPKHVRYNYNKKNDKKIIDLDKPMRCGAFVDPSRVKKYTEDDYILPETPPFSWLLPKPRDENGEDRISLHSPTNVVDAENCSGNANNLINNLQNQSNNNNNNIQQPQGKGSYEAGPCAAGPMHFRLSQSPKSNAGSGESTVGPLAPSSIGMSVPASTTTTTGTSPPLGSLGADSGLRRSSRWSIRRDPSEDERMLKELHFAFAESTAQGELAKFLRECQNAPTLQEFDMMRSSGGDTVTDATIDGSRILTEADTCCEPCERRIDDDDNDDDDDDAINDLTRQLEQFETSLPEYEYLVSSLCQTVDSNSNS
ncbi:autophagy-related protein 13 homolog [Anopheles bellator]|uniref:autophagy-related protein 13 homolog n=1 Tax=Anopheles bellator TaxID=139047 RepID=UPI0026470444|nr:autophagy-related protein 13 homolog [Anopheles bellator]